MARQVGGPGPWGRFAEDASVGWSLVFAVMIGVGLGMLVDNRFGTGPWGVVVGLVWGVGAAGKILADAHRRLTSDD